MSHSQIIRERRRRQQFPEVQPAAVPLVYPRGVKTADVLSIIGEPPAPGWWETRGKLAVDLLADHGITSASITTPSEARLHRLIERWQVRIVINRAFLLPPAAIERAARKFPHVKFVSVNHSSQTDLFRTSQLFQYQWEFLELAGQLENCFIGLVDERNILRDLRQDLGQKCLWMPNPIAIPDTPLRTLGDPPRVSLIAASRLFKNIPTQIQAFGLASRKRELEFLISVRGENGYLREALAAQHIQAEFSDWLEWQEYQQRLQTIDVGLQVSYSETFNYVALQHMLQGGPVVGSTAIRYLPKRWQAKVDDPWHQAAVLLDVLNNWDAESQFARQHAVAFSEQRNREFIQSFEDLL